MLTPPKFTARSPAKLILSGEHAVVYGAPAIAMAVDRYVESSASVFSASKVFFNLSNLKYARTVTLQTLMEVKNRLLNDYRSFLEGKCRIRDVLEKPFELLQFTVSNLLDKLSVHLPYGVQIHTHSTIPIGCGMGSSAATVISTLKALSHFLKIDLDPTKYLSLGKEAENLQHGVSSGLDLRLALQGGGLYFQQGKIQIRTFEEMPFYLINTGAPLSHTGECVEQARSYFTQKGVLKNFQAITESFDRAIFDHNHLACEMAIQENHRLLSYIGVVPQAIQQFIQALEEVGVSAKVSGAGSVRGGAAGVLLAWISPEQFPMAQSIVQQYGYVLEKIHVDHNGTQIV